MKNSEHLQSVANRFFESHAASATAKEMAAWAIAKGHWKPERSSLITQCARELAAAMGEEYYTDPQGRRVRAKHAARIVRGGVQQSLWDDIRTAPREYMEISVKQRRQQIVGECYQIKVDVDSFNQNRSPETPIQFILDFDPDVAELEALRRHELSLASDSTSSKEREVPSRESRRASLATT